MVAYNFQPRFASLVEVGAKMQTVRTAARCKPGDRLQLYTGMRTKACRKLITPDPICTFVCGILIAHDGYIIMTAAGTERPFPRTTTPDELARMDGFSSYSEMYEWFVSKYDRLEFTGKLIKWEPYNVG